MQDLLTALIKTQDGTMTLTHPNYGETFHSLQGARFEAESLYMQASKFRSGLAQAPVGTQLGVLDVGLGLAYNALMTIEAWMLSEGRVDLQLLSLEHSPELIAALMGSGLVWKEGWPDSWLQWPKQLQPSRPGCWVAEFKHPQSARPLTWTIQLGDACAAELTPASLDYIWQDAFSQQKNPELWTPEWFKTLRSASKHEVCLVSYSVARQVRDNLAAAGWVAQRVKAAAEGSGGSVPSKRNWLIAHLPEPLKTT